MKKISILLTISLLLMVITVSANAEGIQGNAYTAQDATVIFEADSIFTAEEQQHIADLLIYGNDEISPYGLSCFLFGHNYETEVATVINHKARATAPRCLSEKYEIKKCSKCGDVQQTLLSSIYINCCS